MMDKSSDFTNTQFAIIGVLLLLLVAALAFLFWKS